MPKVNPLSTAEPAVTLLETLDAKITDAVDRAVRAGGIVVRRSRVTMALDDPRLRQLGTRLEVGAADEAEAKQVSDAVMMRRARLLSFPRSKGAADRGIDGGGTYIDGGASLDSGDCGGDGGGGCD